MAMFVKLFNAILDSSIADDRGLRHFFTDLLLCADSKGYVVMTDSAIARRIGASLEEVQSGLNKLMQPDPLSKTPDQDGRRVEALEGTGYGYRIINFESYRAMRDADQLREATKQRVRRHRAKQKKECNADVTQGNEALRDGNAGNAIEKESKKERESKKEKKTEDQGNAVGAEVVVAWNALDGFSKVKALSAKRVAHLKARLEDPYFAENWRTAIAKIPQSPFLSGQNDRGWTADFDWLLQPESVLRITEGKYDPRSKPEAAPITAGGDSIGGRQGTFTTIE